MNKEVNKQDMFWQILDLQRASGLSLKATLEEAIRKGIPISDEILGKILSLNKHQDWLMLPPKNIESLIYEFTCLIKAKDILDVWAGAGTLTRVVSRAKCVNSAVGITSEKQHYDITSLIPNSGKEKYFLNDSINWLKFNDVKFDLIIANLPFGMRKEEEIFNGITEKVEIFDDYGQRLMLHSVKHLLADGHAIFIVPPKFSFEKSARSVRCNLSNFGAYLNGLIYLRSGTFAPLTNISGYIALVSLKKTEKLFIAELSENEQRNKAIIRFYLEGKEGKEPSLGRWVEEETFHGWEQYKSNLELNSWLKKTGYAEATLKEVVTETLTASEKHPFVDKPNTVYLPVFATGEAVTTRAEIKNKEQNYLQLVVDSNKIEPRFLASFFNSPIGRNVRSAYASGITIPKLTKGSVADMPIFFPSREKQLRITETETKIKNIEHRLSELRTRLTDEPETVTEISTSLAALEREEDFEDWIDQLPFPLATILWHYHVRNEDSKTRYEQLLHFFEALTEFVAAILISGFKSNSTCYARMKSDFRSFLREGSFEKSTFGTWILVVENLGAMGRKALKEWDKDNKEKEVPDVLLAFRTENTAFLEMIFSEKLLDILKSASRYRNLWLGHSGAVDEVEASQRRIELEALLSEARSVMGRCWVGFEMVRALSLNFSAGAYYAKVEKLMGVRTPFLVAEVVLVEPLDDQKLYFFDQKSGRGLEIVPLVKVLASPRSAQNACYFYNRTDKDGVRFVSYYFGSDAEIVDKFSDTKQLISELLP